MCGLSSASPCWARSSAAVAAAWRRSSACAVAWAASDSSAARSASVRLAISALAVSRPRLLMPGHGWSQFTLGCLELFRAAGLCSTATASRSAATSPWFDVSSGAAGGGRGWGAGA